MQRLAAGIRYFQNHAVREKCGVDRNIHRIPRTVVDFEQIRIQEPVGETEIIQNLVPFPLHPAAEKMIEDLLPRLGFPAVFQHQARQLKIRAEITGTRHHRAIGIDNDAPLHGFIEIGSFPVDSETVGKLLLLFREIDRRLCKIGRSLIEMFSSHFRHAAQKIP